METLTINRSESKTNKAMESKNLNLINGQYNLSDAKDVLMSFIDSIINKQSMDLLKKWETSKATSDNPEENLNFLKSKKEELQNFFEKVNHENYKIELNGTLEVKLIK